MTSTSFTDPVQRDLESQYSSVFPLPLAPFEQFLVLDDRADFPMVFAVEIAFHGQLDRPTLEQAVVQAVARNPMLRVHLDWSAKRPQWVLAPIGQPPVVWLTQQEADRGCPIRQIDLRTETGIRVHALAGSLQSKVWLQLHHACCDGLGSRRFIVDLLTGYARASATDSSAPRWDLLDYGALQTRAQFDASAASGKSRVEVSLWQKLREAYHFHAFTPRPLSPAPGAARPSNAPVVCQHLFDPEETTRFRELATRRQTLLNDIAMALLFQSLADWNRKSGPNRQERLRLLMPTDLRGRADDRLPAANRMSFAFLSRTLAQCEDWNSLLAGVRHETAYFKQVQIGRDFLAALDLATRVPGLLPLLLNLPRCMATATLTNLGDPTRRFRRRFPSRDGAPVIGNVQLDYIGGAPPLRPLTRAGFGICLCSRKMSISVVGDRSCLGEAASDLLKSYVDGWRKWAGTVS